MATNRKWSEEQREEGVLTDDDPHDEVHRSAPPGVLDGPEHDKFPILQSQHLEREQQAVVEGVEGRATAQLRVIHAVLERVRVP